LEVEIFFTKAGRVVAWFVTVAGIFSMLAGYEIQLMGTGSVFADYIPYITTPQRAAEQGQHSVEQGVVALFYGLALGILTEISRAVSGSGEE